MKSFRRNFRRIFSSLFFLILFVWFGHAEVMECYDGVDEWKTYENKDLGLQVELPTNWEIVKVTNEDDLNIRCGEDEYKVAIEISKNLNLCYGIEDSALGGVHEDRLIESKPANEYLYTGGDLATNVTGTYIRTFRGPDCWLISHMLFVPRATGESKSDVDFEVNAQQGDVLYEKSKAVLKKMLATLHLTQTAKKTVEKPASKKRSLRR